jgi:hypothetical protein
MVNRISAAGLQVRQYFHRYTDDALDLCDVLGSYVPGGKVKLDEVSKILGLTGKPEGRRHLTVGNGVGGLWKDERVAEKQTTISAVAGGPPAALVAQDTAGQTAP